MRLLLIVPIALLLMLSSCKSKKNIIVKEGEFVSVLSFGAKGNGSNNDRPAIQKAFDSGHNIYFPKGEYILKDKTEGIGFLVINSKIYPNKILFDEGAWLRIDDNPPGDYFKPFTVFIYAKNGPINNISIEGLKIDGNRSKHNLTNGGIILYSEKYLVSDIHLNNTKIKDCGGGGIAIEGHNIFIKDVETNNNGSHGIGINGSPRQPYYVEIENHISIDDDAYSIDFSGPYDTTNPKETVAKYQFKGKLKNSKSINSLNGIKTAGYWDLEMENVLIDGSEYNGFFWSKNTPGKTVTAKNLTIKNCKGNGLYLAGEGKFIGDSITISNSKSVVNIEGTDVEIKGMNLNIDQNSIAGLRMGSSEVFIDGFKIKSTKTNDEYPIWISGKKVTLMNGIIDAEGWYTTIIQDNTGSVTFENVKFLSGTAGRSNNKTGGILKSSNTNSLELINCDFSEIPGRVLDNRSNIKVNLRGTTIRE